MKPRQMIHREVNLKVHRSLLFKPKTNSIGEFRRTGRAHRDSNVLFEETKSNFRKDRSSEDKLYRASEESGGKRRKSKRLGRSSTNQERDCVNNGLVGDVSIKFMYITSHKMKCVT